MGGGAGGVGWEGELGRRKGEGVRWCNISIFWKTIQWALHELTILTDASYSPAFHPLLTITCTQAEL